MPESAGWHNKTNPHVRNGFAQRGRGVAGPFSLFEALIEPPELRPCWNPPPPFIGRSWPPQGGRQGRSRRGPVGFRSLTNVSHPRPFLVGAS